MEGCMITHSRARSGHGCTVVGVAREESLSGLCTFDRPLIHQLRGYGAPATRGHEHGRRNARRCMES